MTACVNIGHDLPAVKKSAADFGPALRTSPTALTVEVHSGGTKGAGGKVLRCRLRILARRYFLDRRIILQRGPPATRVQALEPGRRSGGRTPSGHRVHPRPVQPGGQETAEKNRREQTPERMPAENAFGPLGRHDGLRYN
jgi:hypothetical protein